MKKKLYIYRKCEFLLCSSKIKKIILFQLFFFNIFICQAQIKFFTPPFNCYIFNGLTFKTISGSNALNTGTDFSTEFSSKEFFVKTGIKFHQNIFDLTSETKYILPVTAFFKAGPIFIFHLNHYSNIFAEADFLAGVYTKFNFTEKLSISANAFYFYKTSKIFALPDFIPQIYNHNFAAKIKTIFNPVEPLSLSFSISSYSFYNYMLFFSPEFTLAGEYAISDFISLGNELSIQYIDLFTLSANFNSFESRFFIRTKLK